MSQAYMRGGVGGGGCEGVYVRNSASYNVSSYQAWLDMATISSLPLELFLKIYTNLPFTSRLSLSKTCKTSRTILREFYPHCFSTLTFSAESVTLPCTQEDINPSLQVNEGRLKPTIDSILASPPLLTLACVKTLSVSPTWFDPGKHTTDEKSYYRSCMFVGFLERVQRNYQHLMECVCSPESHGGRSNLCYQDAPFFKSFDPMFKNANLSIEKEMEDTAAALKELLKHLVSLEHVSIAAYELPEHVVDRLGESTGESRAR
jgi:hypothetical protein